MWLYKGTEEDSPEPRPNWKTTEDTTRSMEDDMECVKKRCEIDIYETNELYSY